MTNKQEKLPGLVAHRGFSSQFPENTLIAYQEAFACGACFVECDVQLTRDKVPVLLHDDNLGRTSGIDVSLHDLTYAELKKFSAGYSEKFGDKFRDEKVPLLENFVKLLMKWPDRSAFVELKRSSMREHGYEDVLENILPILEEVCHQVIIISFDDFIIERIQSTGKWRCGWVIEEWTDANLSRAKELNPDYFFVDHECLPEKFDCFPKAKWFWVLYEIDDVGVAEKLIDKKADLIETNDIRKLILSDYFVKNGCN